MLTANGPLATSVVTHRTSLGRTDPEVTVLPASPARARRRHFTAADKLRILHEADHTAIGQLGALLRREGLYSSHPGELAAPACPGHAQRARAPATRTTGHTRGRAGGCPVARGERTVSPQARRGGNGDCGSKKSCHALGAALPRPTRAPGVTRAGAHAEHVERVERVGHHRQRTEIVMESTASLVPTVGVQAACLALGVPPATFYRWRRPLGALPACATSPSAPPSARLVQRRTASRPRRAPLGALLRRVPG